MEYIKYAMEDIESASCVRFVPFDELLHEDYLTIKGSEPGCFSMVGRQGGEQILNLQPNLLEKGCFRRFTIVHELLHLLGFFHMQSASNRDEYIDVLWENINPETTGNFDKYGADMITGFGVEYDYGSVMHYSGKAFSIDGSPTLVPRFSTEEELGQRKQISDKDVEKLNQMYCSENFESSESVPDDLSRRETFEKRTRNPMKVFLQIQSLWRSEKIPTGLLTLEHEVE